MSNYYSLLGIEEYCEDLPKIRAAYLNKVKYFHPDAGNVSKSEAEEMTKELNAAYDTLKDPKKKADYDLQLRYGAASGYGSTQSYSYGSNNGYNGYSQNSYGYYSGGYGQRPKGQQYRREDAQNRQEDEDPYQDSWFGGRETRSGWFGPFHFYYYSSGSRPRDPYGYGNSQDPYGYGNSQDPYGNTQDPYGRDQGRQDPYGYGQQNGRQSYQNRPRYRTGLHRPIFSLWRILILFALISRLASCVNYYIYQNSYYDYYDSPTSPYYQQQEQPQVNFQNPSKT